MVNALSYTEFPTSYIATFSSNLSLNLSINTDNSLISDYTLSFGTNTGRPITIVASGFSDPSANSNGEPFGLWLATADGGDLVEVVPNTLSVANVKTAIADIFPNPVKDYLTINLENNQNTELSLYDIQGRKVLNQNLEMQNEIFLGDLNNGIYVLNLSNDFGNQTMKIKIN